jgi:hypothetical protein
MVAVALVAFPPQMVSPAHRTLVAGVVGNPKTAMPRNLAALEW